MQREEIGYNCVASGVGYLLLFIIFLVAGLAVSAALGWQDPVCVFLNVLLLLCAAAFAFLAGSVLFRPNVLIAADDAALYVFQWRGRVRVELGEIERIAVTQQRLPLFDCGRLTLKLRGGACVRVGGLKDPQGVRVSIEARKKY